MYDTPLGTRVLHNFERAFFVDVLGQLTDELVCANSDYVHEFFMQQPQNINLSVPLIDKLTVGQILLLLRKVAAACLFNNVAPMQPVPHYDSALIYIFQFAHVLLDREDSQLYQTLKTSTSSHEQVQQRSFAKTNSVKLKLQKAIVDTVHKFPQCKALSELFHTVVKLKWDQIGQVLLWHTALSSWICHTLVTGKTIKEREQKLIYLTANENMNFAVFQKRLTSLYVTSMPNSLNDRLVAMNAQLAKQEHETLIAFTYNFRIVDKSSSRKIQEVLKLYAYDNAPVVLHKCEWCLREEEHAKQFKWCGRCHSVCYCSIECQKLHWFSAPPRYETQQDVESLMVSMSGSSNSNTTSSFMNNNNSNLNTSSASFNNSRRFSRPSSAASTHSAGGASTASYASIMGDTEFYKLLQQMGPHKSYCKNKPVNPLV